jgi:hypothetical protein
MLDESKIRFSVCCKNVGKKKKKDFCRVLPGHPGQGLTRQVRQHSLGQLQAQFLTL